MSERAFEVRRFRTKRSVAEAKGWMDDYENERKRTYAFGRERVFGQIIALSFRPRMFRMHMTVTVKDAA